LTPWFLPIVQNPSQEGGMRKQENPEPSQRLLVFDSNQIWIALPDSVQERCRTLCTQLLAEVVKPQEGNDHDGKD
jgi:hypothetical protein